MHVRTMIIGLTALTVGTSAGVTGTEQGDRITVASGVYTREQAKRGEEIYRQECEVCHRDNLEGNGIDGGPPLRGLQFTLRWEGLSVGTMLNTLAELMPLERPASLSRQEYVDVLTFILRANDLPAGEAELPMDPALLSRIIVTFKP